MLKSLSTSLAARGILAAVVGIVALAWPSVTVLTLVILFAVYAFIAAGLQAARAFSSRNAGRSSGTCCSAWPTWPPGRSRWPGRAHRAGPGADHGRMGDHRRPGGVLRRLPVRRAGRDPGYAHPWRAGRKLGYRFWPGLSRGGRYSLSSPPRRCRRRIPSVRAGNGIMFGSSSGARRSIPSPWWLRPAL